MKKGGFLRNVLDTIRSNQAASQSGRHSSGGLDKTAEFGGQLKPHHFSLCHVAQHGFPENPTALAFDPVQKICAIGTKSGAMRVFGRPGVDIWVQHEPAYAVTHMRFIVNQGAIITVTADESIHLWSLRGANLKLQLSAGQQTTSPSPAQQQSISPAPSGGQQLSSAMGTISGSSSSGIHSATSTSTTTPTATMTDISSGVDSAGDFLIVDPLSSSPISADSSKQCSKRPEIIHTLKFQREHITYLHQTLNSKWLYIGTERGNVHVVNVETFELSGYSIAWNKAIELSRKTHPGAIIHISECPQDTNKLLIGYESGCIVLWDLKNRNAEGRYYHAENLLWLSWHYEGKQFIAAHGDGSLITWLTRSNSRPTQIQYPHSKLGPQSEHDSSQQQQQQQRLYLASSLARSLNNELYRPINKVDWKTLRNSEQFYLFSGGLPYDGLDGQQTQADGSTVAGSTSSGLMQAPQRNQTASASPSHLIAGTSQQQQQQQQYLKAASASPNLTGSPISPSISPNPNNGRLSANNQRQTSSSASTYYNQQQLKEKKSLRSTMLTVVLGKSITVLEMGDAIIDFITICDNSPYDNDTSEPYAVIVLLSNELILIDLTSSGYPSYDSPYPSASLNESPVTCIKYLADCSSDLIPFLYSTSQNSVSRAPKKGFSDKEWPINGGEWGQSMQSYPELVITGHADGTIKFWDISGINFDLISKIKTSKLFERSSRLVNSIFIPANNNNNNTNNNNRSTTTLVGQTSGSTQQQRQATTGGRPTSGATARTSSSAARPSSPLRQQQQQQQHDYDHHSSSSPTNEQYQQQQQQYQAASCYSDSGTQNSDWQAKMNDLLAQSASIEENLFAIEKIEFCSSSKHLLVATALSQVIQFRLNKKEMHSGGGGAHVGSGSEISTILVEPLLQKPPSMMSGCVGLASNFKQHIMFRARDTQTAGGSSSGGSSSSSSSHRSRLSGFQAELVCLTPLLVSTFQPTTGAEQASSVVTPSTGGGATAATYEQQQLLQLCHYCYVPPKITALALQPTHSILAYAHINGIVLLDIIQKCVIMNASLSDLYGGSASINPSCKDVGIQPFATSSILQHHYQSQASAVASLTGDIVTGKQIGPKQNTVTDNSGDAARIIGRTNNGSALDNNDAMALQKSGATPNGSTSQASQQQQSRPAPPQSRFTTNSMFQRQLSTNALNATGSGATDAPAAHSAAQGRGRIFQRQMTASQLMTTSGPAAQEAARQRAAALLASVRANAADQAASSGAAAQTRPLVGARAAASKEAAADESQQVSSAAAAAGSACATAAPAKRAPKQKRIISRMLSISAIHATVGSSSSNSSTGNLNSSGNNVEPGEPSARSTSLAASAASQHASSTNALNDTTAGYAMPPNAAPVRPEMAADQVAGGLISDHTSSDKFDSSFVRSRSSSASSATAQWQQQQQQQQQHQQQQSANELNATAHTTASESIQCVAFIDTPAVQAAAGATSGLHAGGVTAAAAAASSGCSHKSLASSSIDSQGGSPLALCLGTSVGSVLLINLTLPDNEDNRVLQLQSVNAEPMPQASLKLPGSILCITMFACEPRNPASSTSSAAQSASAGSTSGPAESSGLSTSGDLSAGAADPNRATSGDSRAVQFLAIVSEKQARVYHLSNCYSSAQSASSPPPQGSSLASGAAPANASQGSIANESTCAASAAHSSFARDAISTPSPSQVQCAPLQSSASSKHPIERNSSTEGPFAKLFAANNANLFSRCDLSESSFVCRSAVVQMRAPGSIDEHCLASYLATGNVLVHTLPRLAAQPIMDADFVPYSNARIASSMQFSRLGHCLYQPSGTEVCKFTISAQYKALVNDMTGALYVAREMPEMPRPNFFKSLLSSVSGAGATSSAKQQSERDELFGELGAGRAQRGVAKHIGASSSSTLDKLKGAAVGTMGHEMRMAREGLDERGEKLSEVEDRTQHMMMQSEVYANAAHQLAQKFKDKKWYQF